jgi:hypothetical protein
MVLPSLDFVPVGAIDAADADIDAEDIFRCHTSVGDSNCQARDAKRRAGL